MMQSLINTTSQGHARGGQAKPCNEKGFGYKSMIDWNKVQKANVIGTFRKLGSKWLGIDIHFFDEFGNCQIPNIEIQNPICRFLDSIGKGAAMCQENYKKHNKSLSKTQQPLLYKCYSGLQVFIMPIIVNEKYAGAIFACGLYSTKLKTINQKEYIDKITELGFDRAKVERSSKELKSLNGHSMQHLQDFIKLVADYVKSLYETLQEKDGISNMQSVLSETAYNNKYKGIIGVSSAMRDVFDTLDLLENSENPLLIEGETGTGKELLAAAVHYNSTRRDKMFILQNCSSFSETLLSSELFGHEKGAFTGAISNKKGLFEIADGGTLFLDEIGDMNIGVQTKLLRVLEDGTFLAVGGTEKKKVNVRIIVSTNKELKKQAEKGLFREDLLSRINTWRLIMPSLRDRKDDILPLANYFMETFTEIHNVDKKELSKEVIERLTEYKWPGNVRELKYLIKYLIMIYKNEKVIKLEHLPNEISNATNIEEGDSKCKRGAKL